MAAVFVMLTLTLIGSLSASPVNSERQHQHLPNPPPSSVQLSRFSMLPYYLENPEQVNNYYAQHAEKHMNGAPPPPSSRLESLEPDSEVEILPGAQQPQPPQQNPVQPNLPGLIPGQRVFIVHMPVPGYRPGTVGGYQPVYVVAAAPNGNNNNNNYAPNGYQNPLIDPSTGQVLISPYGFPHLKQNFNHGYYVVGPAHIAPAQVALARPYESLYQHQQNPGFNQAVGVVPNPAASPEALQSLRLSQLIGLYPPQGHVVANLQNLQSQEKDNVDPNARSSRLMHAVDAIDIKESGEEIVNGRPVQKANKQ